ncbi:hypothetical protein QAD02_023966 [Eretmocerus hayati]|uniref:Uncharacterized protein n=1 Tax=Eretmocerus hayati TaxID=131215 RepID=A0ACC2PZ05_9HYME|nr:hypothetical protein QAD02_023966 [Eretmocerus hayati]
MSRALFLLISFGVNSAICYQWSGSKPSQTPKLVTEFEWNYFDYDWPSTHKRDYYIKQGWYNPKSIVSIDVDRSADGRTFLTTIRDKGVPASVHTISRKNGKSGPLLIPYPDWSWYENPNNCNRRRILNAYRVAIDKCNRLWVLDTGYIALNYTCPAQLLAFNLKTDRLDQHIEIPRHLASKIDEVNLLITPVVQIGKTCHDITRRKNEGCIHRIKEREFQPEQQNSNFTIAGEKFFLDDGIFGLALTPPPYSHKGPELFFRPLASKSIYAASTYSLNQYHDGDTLELSRAGKNYFPSQATAMSFSSKGILFYGLTEQIGIGCWDSANPFQRQYFKTVLQDRDRLQFVSGLKVVKRQSRKTFSLISSEPEEYLLMSSNRLQKIYAGTQNLNEANFRILRVEIKALDECLESPPHPVQNSPVNPLIWLLLDDGSSEENESESMI